MTLTEVNKILTKLGLFKVDSKFPEYYHEYCFNSPIFKHQPGLLVRVDECQSFFYIKYTYFKFFNVKYIRFSV
jgi:hypothetical protein